MARADGRKKRTMSPFKAGLIALVLIAIGSFFGFTKANPFANPYEFSATFESANNLKTKSPVRIAGVNVGKVKEVKPLADGSGAADVKMEIQKEGLPIHVDAELKIRQRIFLEGNFFVDVQPGSPSAKVLPKGGRIPVNQTATPVQFGQILTALQSDTREDLQTFLREYATKGLKGGGAEAFNESIKYWEPAYKYSALANQATLGQRPGDLQRLLRGQARTFAALARSPETLKDLITNFNTTAAAFAREDDALQATIPALRDVLRVGVPALISLNSSLPSLRAFAIDALPGTRSSGPTIDASMPFIRQARRLVSEPELKGLVRDLRSTIPALVRLNRATIPLLAENRALSSCQNRVLLPFSKTPIPDTEFPEQHLQPFYKQGPRSFVGLAGESKVADANSPLFHVQFLGGPTTVVNNTGNPSDYLPGSGSTQVFGQTAFPLEGTQPAKPRAGRGLQPTDPPPHRPDVPCETQEPPDLNAPVGRPDPFFTRPPGVDFNVPLPIGPNKKDADDFDELVDYMLRRGRGLPGVDPLRFDEKGEDEEERKLGFPRPPKDSTDDPETIEGGGVEIELGAEAP